MTIRENFPLEKLGIAQFVKIFPLENNPLYSILLYFQHQCINSCFEYCLRGLFDSYLNLAI